MPRNILGEDRIHPAIRQFVTDNQADIVREVQDAVASNKVVVVGMAINPVVVNDPAANAHVGFDPYHAPHVDRLVNAWRPLTVALNSMNRSMGQPDLYPHALTPPVVEKLRFRHALFHGL